MPKQENTGSGKNGSSKPYDPAETFLGSREHGMTTARTQAFLDLLSEAKRKVNKDNPTG